MKKTSFIIMSMCLLVLMSMRGFANTDYCCAFNSTNPIGEHKHADTSEKCQLLNFSVPIGGMIIWSSAVKIPKDYLPCDGRKLNTSDYKDLYKVIGDTFAPTSAYHGDGSAFFLPDLRGMFVRGWDDSGKIDPNVDRKFGSYQDDAFQGHGHITNALVDGGRGSQNGGYGGASAKATTPIDLDGYGDVRFSTETRPMNVALIYLIRYKQSFFSE
jgi:microcystin-dependent protein